MGTLLIGTDEAGRGSPLGHLFVGACAYFEHHEHEIISGSPYTIQDSKKIKSIKHKTAIRNYLFSRTWHAVECLHAEWINRHSGDLNINTAELEANAIFTIIYNLYDQDILNPEEHQIRIIVDELSGNHYQNVQRYLQYLLQIHNIENVFNYTLEVHKHADDLFKVVSCGSIFAKTARDESMLHLNVGPGAGYYQHAVQYIKDNLYEYVHNRSVFDDIVRHQYMEKAVPKIIKNEI